LVLSTVHRLPFQRTVSPLLFVRPRLAFPPLSHCGRRNCVFFFCLAHTRFPSLLFDARQGYAGPNFFFARACPPRVLPLFSFGVEKCSPPARSPSFRPLARHPPSLARSYLFPFRGTVLGSVLKLSPFFFTSMTNRALRWSGHNPFSPFRVFCVSWGYLILVFCFFFPVSPKLPVNWFFLGMPFFHCLPVCQPSGILVFEVFFTFFFFPKV